MTGVRLEILPRYVVIASEIVEKVTACCSEHGRVVFGSTAMWQAISSVPQFFNYAISNLAARNSSDHLFGARLFPTEYF